MRHGEEYRAVDNTEQKKGSTVSLVLRMPPELHRAVDIASKRLGVSMNSLIVSVLSYRPLPLEEAVALNQYISAAAMS